LNLRHIAAKIEAIMKIRLLLILLPLLLSAQIRDTDPLVITNHNLFGDILLSEITPMVLRDGIWLEVPYQIDERAPSGNLFEEDDIRWDLNDELILLSADAGEKAEANEWPLISFISDDARISIECIDPVDGDTAYFYLYHAVPLSETVFLMDYDFAEITISSANYKAGMNTTHGFLNEIRFNDGGDFGSNMMDRSKLRIRGEVFGFEWLLTEEDFILSNSRFAAGPLRISLETTNLASVFGNAVETRSTQYFYPTMFESPLDTINIPADVGTNLFRISFDLNTAAIPAVMASNHNSSLVVDGTPDTYNSSLDPEDLDGFWLNYRFAENEAYILSRVGNIGNDPGFYYYDNTDGGSADGTSDTGDGASYGDAGFQFNSLNSGSHINQNRFYFVAKDQLSAEKALAYFQQPLVTIVSTELFVGLEDTDVLLTESANLLQNYPNPFNPATFVPFHLKNAARVKITVYNAIGQRHAILADENYSAGYHRVQFRAGSLAAGLYFYSMSVNGKHVSTKKMMLIK
jgi:hypothetical protein